MELECFALANVMLRYHDLWLILIVLRIEQRVLKRRQQIIEFTSENLFSRVTSLKISFKIF